MITEQQGWKRLRPLQLFTLICFIVSVIGKRRSILCRSDKNFVLLFLIILQVNQGDVLRQAGPILVIMSHEWFSFLHSTVIQRCMYLNAYQGKLVDLDIKNFHLSVSHIAALAFVLLIGFQVGAQPLQLKSTPWVVTIIHLVQTWKTQTYQT